MFVSQDFCVTLPSLNDHRSLFLRRTSRYVLRSRGLTRSNQRVTSIRPLSRSRVRRAFCSLDDCGKN